MGELTIPYTRTHVADFAFIKLLMIPGRLVWNSKNKMFENEQQGAR